MDMTGGHHRPVPHDGDRSRRGAHRPCARQPDPDPVQHRRRPRRRASRSASGPPPIRLAWLAAIGLLTLFAFALIWLATALGLAAKSVETASNTPMFLTLLPFLGSGFVPTATMPAGLRQFAEYQPFTPVTETLRGLLTGTHVGDNAIAAIAWSVGIALAGYLWARHLYNRRRAR